MVLLVINKIPLHSIHFSKGCWGICFHNVILINCNIRIFDEEANSHWEVLKDEYSYNEFIERRRKGNFRRRAVSLITKTDSILSIPILSVLPQLRPVVLCSLYWWINGCVTRLTLHYFALLIVSLYCDNICLYNWWSMTDRKSLTRSYPHITKISLL